MAIGCMNNRRPGLGRLDVRARPAEDGRVALAPPAPRSEPGEPAQAEEQRSRAAAGRERRQLTARNLGVASSGGGPVADVDTASAFDVEVDLGDAARGERLDASGDFRTAEHVLAVAEDGAVAAAVALAVHAELVLALLELLVLAD